MILDNIDIEFLKLCGLCRYIPTGLERRYDTPILSKGTISNLQVHSLIKKQSDASSYKLTLSGRKLLEGTGYSFPKDARLDIHKASYTRKLISAEICLMMYLAGTDAFYRYPKELAGTDEGYASTLIMRADKNMKVLSGSKFLGIYKNGDTAYIPYFAESAENRILPNFEREMFMSQIEGIKKIKSVKLMLFGRSLEELWRIITAKSECKTSNGRKTFNEALEEMGIEYLLVPCGQGGVLQLSILRDCRYRGRIASAAGITPAKDNMPDCDGIQGNSPYIIALDMNVDRIVRALEQVKKEDKSLVPTICCLPFQKSTILRVLNRYGCQRTTIRTIDTESIGQLFPKRDMTRKEFMSKEGEYVEAPPKPLKTAKEE